ncbi:MAG: hypothetical protein PHO41_11915, partial [Eubacteriales bacterium]|nr:hypothetical protein [Eubacteriales bacterium]
VQLSDGGTAALSDVVLDDPDVNRLYDEAEKFNTQGAKTFIEEYDGTASISNYSRAFRSVYDSASKGLSYEQVISNSLFAQNYLSQGARESAFAAGLAVEKPANAAPAAAPDVDTATPAAPDAQQRTGGVVRNFSRKLNKGQEQSIRAIDAVAKAIGRTVNIVENLEGRDGKASINVKDTQGSYVEGTANAYFDPNTNEYYISLNGIGEAYVFFALHENIHDIAANNPLGYENLEQIVFDVLKERGVDTDALISYQMEKFGYDKAAAREEVVANTVPSILTDKQTADMFIERIIGADADTRTAFEKVIDSIREFLQKVYKTLAAEKSWEQMEQVKGSIDALERIREAYFSALEELRAGSNTGIALESMDKYSQKDQDVIEAYLNAVDDAVLAKAQLYRDNKQAKHSRIKVADVDDRLASAVKSILGIDVSNYSVWADKVTFTHIEKRHGIAGTQDKSMANLNDVARMGFVVENFDSVEWCLDQNGDRVYSKRINGADGKPAPVMLLAKQINGTYYLSEAVADNRYNKLWVESAYINKKGVTQDTTAKGQVSTSETGPASPPTTKLSQGRPSVKDEAQEFSDADIKFSVRDEAPPQKTGIAYKVFMVKNGQLYPPMVANPGGEGTPVGIWLNADVGAQAPASKTGRPQVQSGGRGTSTGKGSLAFRPGWHLGDIPIATQFARTDPETGEKTLFPADFVWAECEYAMDVDYQQEAMSYGYTDKGKFRHSYAGLPKIPKDGYYRYRTNPAPDTVPWVITGAMRVNRILTDAETDAICRENGVEPMKRQGGVIDLEKHGLKSGVRFSMKNPIEESDGLIALHNLNDAKLTEALRLGGFPMPSIAVTKAS